MENADKSNMKSKPEKYSQLYLTAMKYQGSITFNDPSLAL